MKEIKNIHSHKIFQWFPENLTKYLFNQIEQNYKYFILQHIWGKSQNMQNHGVCFCTFPPRAPNTFSRFPNTIKTTHLMISVNLLII